MVVGTADSVLIGEVPLLFFKPAYTRGMHVRVQYMLTS